MKHIPYIIYLLINSQLHLFHPHHGLNHQMLAQRTKQVCLIKQMLDY